MQKITEIVKNTYTHEVNRDYYYDFPTCKYVWIISITIEKNHEALEAIWMHTSVISIFDPQTPLGGPMIFLIIQNGHEYMCEHGKGMLEHKWRYDRCG